jgi:hypothetical protein
MVKTPAHQQWQQRHCDKGSNTSLMMAITPSQQGQKCYHVDGKDAWTSKMPVRQ